MARLIIEVLNRIGHVSERFKYRTLPVKIGRSYANDLILSDLHISAEHAVIHEHDDGWIVEDLDSINGVQIKSHSTTPTAPNQLLSGDDLIIGRTHLRLYSPWHPVSPTHIIPTHEEFSKVIAKPHVTLLIVILALIALATNQQLTMTKDYSIAKLIAQSLPPLIAAVIWGGVWAFVGRVIKHKANFNVHFSAAVLFTLAMIVIQIFAEYTTYNNHSIFFANSIEFIFVGIAIAILLNTNLKNSTATSKTTRLITCHSLSWGILVVSAFMQYASQPDFHAMPRFPTTLKPPFAKIVSSQSLEDFFKESEKIFITAEE